MAWLGFKPYSGLEAQPCHIAEQLLKQTVCQAISIIVKHSLFYTLILPILSFLFQNVILSFLYLGTLPNEYYLNNTAGITHLVKYIVTTRRMYKHQYVADILLYLCETGDGRQSMRNRLFVRWFNQYVNHDLYYFDAVEIAADGVDNFAAIIVQKSNPQLAQIVAEFDEVVAELRKQD